MSVQARRTRSVKERKEEEDRRRDGERERERERESRGGRRGEKTGAVGPVVVLIRKICGA